MASLPRSEDPNLLVGYGTNDDAGIYRLTDEIAIVTTADFITPPVNNPYEFGQIAAANAISDIYAMGAEPKVCLNLVSFPSKVLPPDHLHQIVAGALNKITESGAVLAGGHSVEDSEPKFGLSVVGIVHPQKFWTNGGAQPGDRLILTKPLGSGVLFNANLKKWVSGAAMAECVRITTTLNKYAANALSKFDVHGVTDVTGFGLAGHALEMAKASGVCLEIALDALPIMDEAIEMYRKGMRTGVNAFNERLVAHHCRINSQHPRWHQQILYDPQTSGGLLVAIPSGQSAAAIQAVNQTQDMKAAMIGEVHPLKDKTQLIFK